MNYDQVKLISKSVYYIFYTHIIHNSPIMQQQNSPTQSESHNIDPIVQAIAEIMNQESQNQGNVSMFLSKIFKNNVSNKNKKMKSIRLSRFVLFLRKFCQQFPTQSCTLQVVYQCIYSMLLNKRNFQDEEDEEHVQAIGIQIARTVEATCQTVFIEHASNLLNYLLYNKKPAIMEVKKFQELLKESSFFKKTNIDEDELQEDDERLSLQEVSIEFIILDNLNFEKVYNLMFKKMQNKKLVTQCFYDHAQHSSKKSHNKIKLFKQCFLEQPLTSIVEIESILSIVNSPMFDCINTSEIIRNIVKQKISLDILCSVNLKQTPQIEDIYVQSLAQEAKGKSINELIKLFIQSSSINNYFLLYLIFKSQNSKIPCQYLDLIFDESAFTNRKAIIFCLAVLDNIGSTFLLLRKYGDLDNKFKTDQFNSRYLKIIHFSVQNTSKSAVFSNILKFVQSSLLNDNSNLDFITYQNLKSEELNQQTKRMINELVKQKLIQNDNIYKMKIDLESVSGNNQPLIQNLKAINKIFQKSLEEIIKLLPTLDEALLQPVLMGINNKFGLFFSQDQFGNTLDWALKNYKKYLSEFGNQLKDFLVQKNKAKQFALIKTLIQYNMQRKQGINFQKTSKEAFDNDLIQLINFSQNSCQKAELYQNSRLKDLNFNDFYLMQSRSGKIQTKKGKILWLKTILIELKSFVKNIVSGQKVGNRKEIKIIQATDVENVLALKIIHEYFASKINAKDILRQVFSTLKPEHQFFDMIQKLAGVINQQFFSLSEMLSDILTEINCEVIDFLAKLFQSKAVQDKKKKKKKNQKQTNDQNSKYLQVLQKNICPLFGNPNELQSYENLFSIVKKCSDKMEPVIIANEVNQFLDQIKYFSGNTYQEWRKKLISLVSLWTIVDKLISKHLNINTIQKHFNMFTDCLNKFYQQFRNKQDFLDVQQKILKTLLIIYSQQSFETMDQERSIPPQLLKNVLQKCCLKQTHQSNYFMCHTCKKSVCSVCASFVHRPHDKTYTGKQGTCAHDNAQPKKAKRSQQPTMKMPVQSLFRRQDSNQSSLIIPRYRFDDRQQQIRMQEQELAFLIAQKNRLGRQNSASIKQMFQNRYYTFARTRIDRERDRQRQNRQRDFKKSPMKGGDFMKFLIESKECQLSDLQNLDLMEIRSQSQKQFCLNQTHVHNIDKFKSKISPQFNSDENSISIPLPKIKMTPLSNLFIRQLHNGTISQNENQKGLKIETQSRVTGINQKYTFFKCAHYKDQRADTYRQRGGYGGYNYGGGTYGTTSATGGIRRNVLCCNKKNLIYPSSLALISLNFAKIKTRFEYREQNKNYGQIQQQKLYISAPNNISYEIIEFQMSKSNSHPIIALVGINQLTFYPLNNQGRFSKIVNPQFNRSQNITKFLWIDGKNVFAIAYNNYIRIGALTANNQNIKNIAKVHVNKQIRDFDAIVSSKWIILFIVDTQGNLYKIQEDIRQSKNISINAEQKKVTINVRKDKNNNKPKKINENVGSFDDQSSSSYVAVNLGNQNQKIQPKIGQIYSIKLLSKLKLLVNMANGDLNIVDVKRTTLKLQATSFNLKKIIQTNPNLQTAYLMQSVKLMRRNQGQNSFTIGCLLRRLNPFESHRTRKHMGYMAIMSLKLGQNSIQLLANNEQNTQSFDFTSLNDTSCMVIYINDDGLMTMFRYSVSSSDKKSKQDIGIQLNDELVTQMNLKFKQENILSKTINFSNVKALQFKQCRDLSNVNKFEYGLATYPGLVKISPYNPLRNFVTGFSMIVQASNPTQLEEQKQKFKKTWEKQCQIEFTLLNTSYNFSISSSTNANGVTSATRQIQIPFSLKQSLQLFINNSNAIQFVYKIAGKQCAIKSIKVYGIQRQSNSYYLKGYTELVKIYKVYKDYQQKKPQIGFNNFENKQSKCVQYYLSNKDRSDIQNVPSYQFDKFFEKHKYAQIQSNFLLKLQLFAQTLGQYLQTKNQKEIQEFIESTKKLLLENQEFHKRKSIQSAVLKLISIASKIYCKKFDVKTGHPYEGYTLLNCYYFEKQYNQWKSRKSLSTFKRFLKGLSKLIFRRVVNLYIILQIYPQLMIEISLYFHSLINDQKVLQDQSADNQHQNLFTKSNVCSLYISIVCQYYQLLKNKNIENSQEKIVTLLEKVFELLSKKQFNKQIFLNPFVYLQGLYCQGEKIQVQCSVKLFNLKNIEFSLAKFVNIQESFQKTSIKRQAHRQTNTNVMELEGMREDQNAVEENVDEDSFIDQPEQQQKNQEQQQKQMEMYLQMQENQWENEQLQMIKRQESQINLQNTLNRPRGPRQNRPRRDISEPAHNLDQNDNDVAEQMQLQEQSDNADNQNKPKNNNYNNQKLSDCQITKFLLSKLKSVQQSKKLTPIYYHEFSLQIAINLFKRTNYLNKTNIVFYMGLFFNLLRIIQQNLQFERTAKNFGRFIQEVNNSLDKSQNSALFLILSSFIQCHYERRSNIDRINVKISNGRICAKFLQFYQANPQRFKHLLQKYDPQCIHPRMSINDVLRFKDFQIKNQQYNLKFIANIYLNLRLKSVNIQSARNVFKVCDMENVKWNILFNVVKHNATIHKNIMYYEKWEIFEDKAKVLVGFEKLHNDIKNGVQLLLSCSRLTPQIFIQELNNDQNKIAYLQHLLMNDSNDQEQYCTRSHKEEQPEQMSSKLKQKLMNLLNIYYKN